MAKYQRIEKDQVEGERHAGYVIKDNQVLLIFRKKRGYGYYLVPGW